MANKNSQVLIEAGLLQSHEVYIPPRTEIFRERLQLSPFYLTLDKQGNLLSSNRFIPTKGPDLNNLDLKENERTVFRQEIYLILNGAFTSDDPARSLLERLYTSYSMVVLNDVEEVLNDHAREIVVVKRGKIVNRLTTPGDIKALVKAQRTDNNPILVRPGNYSITEIESDITKPDEDILAMLLMLINVLPQHSNLSIYADYRRSTIHHAGTPFQIKVGKMLNVVERLQLKEEYSNILIDSFVKTGFINSADREDYHGKLAAYLSELRQELIRNKVFKR